MGQLQDFTLIRELLEGGYPNINEVDMLGISPLAYAAYLGNMDLLEIALDHGADLNITNRSGASPLTLAAKHKRYYNVYCWPPSKYCSSGLRSHSGFWKLAPLWIK